MKTEQRRILATLFFLFGFGIMAWVPRFPEVKQNLQVGNGQFGTFISLGEVGSVVSAIPYVLFVLAMIIGLLTIHHITKYIGIDRLVRLCTIIGGVAFIAAITLGVQVSKSSSVAGFSIEVVGYFIAGLSTSFLAPTFVHAASRRSNAIKQALR